MPVNMTTRNAPIEPHRRMRDEWRRSSPARISAPRPAGSGGDSLVSGFGVRAYRMTGNPHDVPKISLAFAQRFGISATRSAILARYWFVMVKSGVQSKAAENSFNAVRLLAALQVAYIHAIAHLKLAPTWGYEWIVQFPGVPIFFAVSGYLVFDSLFRLRSLKRFAAHRAARIYPALAVNILIIEVLLYAAGQIEFTRSLSAVWALLFFICYAATASYNIASLWGGSGGGTLSFDGFFQIYPSGVLWTLTVELTFYAAIPIAALMKSRASQTILIAAASAASFAFQKFLGPDSPLTVTITIAPYFCIFVISMLFLLC